MRATEEYDHDNDNNINARYVAVMNDMYCLITGTGDVLKGWFCFILFSLSRAPSLSASVTGGGVVFSVYRRATSIQYPVYDDDDNGIRRNPQQTTFYYYSPRTRNTPPVLARGDRQGRCFGVPPRGGGSLWRKKSRLWSRPSGEALGAHVLKSRFPQSASKITRGGRTRRSCRDLDVNDFVRCEKKTSLRLERLESKTPKYDQYDIRPPPQFEEGSNVRVRKQGGESVPENDAAAVVCEDFRNLPPNIGKSYSSLDAAETRRNDRYQTDDVRTAAWRSH